MIKMIIQKIKDLNKDKTINSNDSTISNSVNRLNELLSDNIELLSIPDAFQLLLSSNEKIKLQIAEILNNVMSSFNSTQLIKLDKIFRESMSYDSYNDWRNRNPKELLHPSMSEEEKITILGLCSFHPNGYFREKAIIALTSMEKGQGIPYVLIRINDWVKQVRNTSKEQLLIYLTPEHAMSFVNNLPLVLRLIECSRDEHIEIINAIISIISNEEGAEKLISGLKSKDSKVRLACYIIILQTKVMDNRSIIDYLIKDKNPYNRLFVLRHIHQGIKQDEFFDISPLLLQDKFAQIRIIALEKLYYFMPEEAMEQLEKSLFDNNQSVRELSRYLLAKQKEYDFSNIYRYAIGNNDKLYAAICGLGETGNINDSKIISRFLHSQEVKIVKASINALAQLDIKGYKEGFIWFLNDERSGISKTARRVLHKVIYASDAAFIYEIFKKAIYNHVKINTCLLLCTLSKWNSLRYIIEFCADKNESILEIGQWALERWIIKYNQSFTKPTNNQIDEIRKSLVYFGNSIKDSDRDFIEFIIKDFNK